MAENYTLCYYNKIYIFFNYFTKVHILTSLNYFKNIPIIFTYIQELVCPQYKYLTQ